MSNYRRCRLRGLGGGSPQRRGTKKTSLSSTFSTPIIGDLLLPRCVIVSRYRWTRSSILPCLRARYPSTTTLLSSPVQKSSPSYSAPLVATSIHFSWPTRSPHGRYRCRVGRWATDKASTRAVIQSERNINADRRPKPESHLPKIQKLARWQLWGFGKVGRTNGSTN